MKHILTLTLLLIAMTLQAQKQYADRRYWFEGETRLSKRHIDKNQPDVFYILPTCVFAWQDADGITHYNADPLKAEHRKAWQLSAELADTIFATRANLFLPYYRQSTFGAPDAAAAREAGRLARRDVVDSFRYYLKHLNGGRPFILAGFSQGARMVVELLKAMDDKTYQRLIAAYVVGYAVTADDTLMQSDMPLPGRHKLQHIRMASDAHSRGVTVSFNSVATPEAISPAVTTGSIGCINPVSWTTASVPATLLPAGAAPQPDDKRFPYGTAPVAISKSTPVTVEVDPARHVLMVKGLDTKRYVLPSLSKMFPEGNLHLQELFFYADHLRDNVLLRSGRF